MNSLQLQCWSGGIIPVVNPNQCLTEFVVAAGSTEDLINLLSPNQLTEIKTILAVNDDSASTGVMNGGVVIQLDYGSGLKTVTGSSNQTPIFVVTSELTILNIVVFNFTNKQMRFFVYS